MIHSVSFSQDSIGKTYTIKFSRHQTNLSKEADSILINIARSLKDQPNYNLEMICHCGYTENERLNVANWDRINKIINRFVKRFGLKADRFFFHYGQALEDCDTVELRFTDEKFSTDGPPHPNLLKKN